MGHQLAHLPTVERLGQSCIRILGGNPSKFTLQGTNTYLLGTGPSRILIDTGEGKASWKDAMKKTLEAEAAVVEQALITHWHPDHVGGVGQLLELCPGARVHKMQPLAGQGGISDGQRFSVAGATLEAFHAPGHTSDHMVFIWAEEDAMFTGDNVLGHGTAVFEDLATYLASLERMKARFSGRAYPGHGPVLSDGPGKIDEYIAHRREREAQVVRTLGTDNAGRGDAWTAMDIVKVVYRDVPENLHQAASGGVAQILGKLEKDGSVSRTGEKWKLIRAAL